MAIAFGEVLFDVFEDGAHLGGAPLNFAFYLRQYGIPVAVMSSVGGDELGRQAEDKLKSAGIDCSLLTRNNAPTGYVTVKLKNGQPEYTIHENVAWDSIGMIEGLQSPELLYFGTLSQRTQKNRDTLAGLLALKPKIRFFDVNLRQKYYNKEIILHGLKNSDIVKFNDDEWRVVKQMTSMDTLEDLSEKFGIDIVVLTKGEKGAVLYSKGKTHECGCPKVNVTDAVGAGDAFSAVICAGVLKGTGLEKTLALACEVGAYVVTKRGAQQMLPRSLLEL